MARRTMPSFRAPQLATLVRDVPAEPGWLFEMKYDGYRCLAAVAGKDVRLFTRSGRDWTDRFRSLVPSLRALTKGSALIDGEVCAVDSTGRTDFSTLTSALQHGGPLVYFAFDLLEENGTDLSSLPLVERKQRLERLLSTADAASPVHYSPHVVREGQQVLDAICREGHEGIIAKRGDAPYRGARTRDWVKVKCGRRGNFEIVGWTPSSRRNGFASLLLAEREQGMLRYRGRVGTGFTADSAAALQQQLNQRATDKPAVATLPRTVARTARWVRPGLVADVAFTELTNEGLLRHPSFMGLHTAAEETPMPVDRWELALRGSLAAALENVTLTSPDRVVFGEQGLTKADLAGYYDAVAERILPHLAGRPLSLLRCPQGRAKSCFFQKHDSGGFPSAMHSITIVEKDGEAKPYFVVRDLAGLLGGTQMNVLEWHVWGSREDDVERPDRLVFDLDPDEQLPFSDVRDAARSVADLLHVVGIESFPMLSGGKGIHVVAPLYPEAEWPAAKAFSRAVADRLAAHEPDRFVATMSKARRKGRIFVDYLRNDRGATAIIPWSTRARPGAPVAVPVSWKDLASIDAANQFSIDTAMARASAGDPWPDYFDLAQRLDGATARLAKLT